MQGIIWGLVEEVTGKNCCVSGSNMNTQVASSAQ